MSAFAEFMSRQRSAKEQAEAKAWAAKAQDLPGPSAGELHGVDLSTTTVNMVEATGSIATAEGRLSK